MDTRKKPLIKTNNLSFIRVTPSQPEMHNAKQEFFARPVSKNMQNPVKKTEVNKKIPDKVSSEVNDYYDQLYEMWENVIDCRATGERLQNLRTTNPEFGKFFCKVTRVFMANDKYDNLLTRQDVANTPNISDNYTCHNNFNCDNCTEYPKHIASRNMKSRQLLSRSNDGDGGLSPYTEDKIKANEIGVRYDLELILLYSMLSKTPIQELIVLKNGFHLNENGVVIWDDLEKYLQNNNANDDNSL